MWNRKRERRGKKEIGKERERARESDRLGEEEQENVNGGKSTDTEAGERREVTFGVHWAFCVRTPNRTCTWRFICVMQSDSIVSR